MNVKKQALENSSSKFSQKKIVLKYIFSCFKSFHKSIIEKVLSTYTKVLSLFSLVYFDFCCTNNLYLRSGLPSLDSLNKLISFTMLSIMKFSIISFITTYTTITHSIACHFFLVLQFYVLIVILTFC